MWGRKLKGFKILDGKFIRKIKAMKKGEIIDMKTNKERDEGKEDSGERKQSLKGKGEMGR